MVIEVITRPDEWMEQLAGQQQLAVKVDGKHVFNVQDDEPEDSNLSRSFSDCYQVANLLKEMFERGQQSDKNEKVEIKKSHFLF